MARQRRGPSRPLSPEAQGRAEGHLHLVEVLAWEQYRRCGRTVPLDELLGEARLALAYGASLYDAATGVPFGAYATFVIRHRLHQAVTVWRRGGRLDHVRFTAPVFHGDTLYALTEVLDKQNGEVADAGQIRFRHVGFNQTESVVFDGERTVLMRRRPVEGYGA